jgi:hypothetical protein
MVPLVRLEPDMRCGAVARIVEVGADQRPCGDQFPARRRAGPSRTGYGGAGREKVRLLDRGGRWAPGVAPRAELLPQLASAHWLLFAGAREYGGPGNADQWGIRSPGVWRLICPSTSMDIGFFYILHRRRVVAHATTHGTWVWAP